MSNSLATVPRKRRPKKEIGEGMTSHFAIALQEIRFEATFLNEISLMVSLLLQIEMDKKRRLCFYCVALFEAVISKTIYLLQYS